MENDKLIEEHNACYKQGCSLISQYMHFHNVDSAPSDSKTAKSELNRGIALLKRVVEINPRNFAAYWVMGKGYQVLNDSKLAWEAFGQSFAIERENPDVAREYVFECLNLGKVEEGVAAAEHAVGLNPEDAGLVANLALAYLIGGKLEDAMQAAEESLMLAPDDEITQNLKRVIHEVQNGDRPQPKSMKDLMGP